MAKEYIEPAGDFVSVIDRTGSTVVDGIELPENTREKEMIFGTVVFVGPDAAHLTKPEDIVAYGPYAGKNVIVNGMQFRMLRQGQIEFYLRSSQ